MPPYAEAGSRSLLFAGDVFVCDTGRLPVVEVTPSILPDLLTLHEREMPMTIESDAFGTVYKNGEPVGFVSIPKSAVFETMEKSD